MALATGKHPLEIETRFQNRFQLFTSKIHHRYKVFPFHVRLHLIHPQDNFLFRPIPLKRPSLVTAGEDIDCLPKSNWMTTHGLSPKSASGARYVPGVV
jgi:hypothetical protein